MQARAAYRFAWVAEPFAEEATHVERPLFGCPAHYLAGRLVLVRAARGAPPWEGLLFPTERDRHAALCAEYPALEPHPVLGKWLYLPASSPEFEGTAEALAERIRARDPRLGIEPAGPKKDAAPREDLPGRRAEHPSRRGAPRRGGSTPRGASARRG